mgnify:CR=1 FL=1
MYKAVVSAKGQIVIPSALRKKFGVKKRTQVCLYEKDGEIIIKPITDEYIHNMAGMARTKGRLLKALMEEKAKEHEGFELKRR